MLDSRIIDRLYELDLSNEEIVLISYMYDNGDITEEDIFDIGEDEVFDIEKVGEYELNTDFDIGWEDYYNGPYITCCGEEWYVFDSEESAYDAAIESCKNLIDEIGITGINFDYIGGIEKFVDTDWFEDAERESFESYCYDIEYENDSTYGNRLVEECYNEGLIDDGDFEEDEEGEPDFTQCLLDTDELVERYVDKHMSEIVDFVELYKFNFGEQEFSDTIINRNLIDIDELAEACVDCDGIAHELSGYDGEEVTYDFNGNTYYMYRNN